jgi:ubiquinone biosynthesis protein COQ4
MTLELGRAFRATAALFRDPEDTPQVFALIEALSGTSTPRRIAHRLAHTRLLRERPKLVGHLADRSELRRLPPGSLGHAYLRFVESEGISAEGLREASQQGESGGPAADAVEFVRDRMRDQHDLWHVVLGYGADVLGEAALLAFTFAQTGNPAIGVLVLVGLARLYAPDARQLIGRALVRGLRAAWCPAQEWEALLGSPLDEVRARLRAGPPAAYTPVRAADLRALTAGLIH